MGWSDWSGLKKGVVISLGLFFGGAFLVGGGLSLYNSVILPLINDSKAEIHLSTPEDFLKIESGRKHVLDNDIDFEGRTLIGLRLEDVQAAEFVLDGKDHAIKNIKLSSDGNCVGLISVNDGRTVIKNLKMENFTIDYSYEDRGEYSGLFLGGLVGLDKGALTIENCSVTGSIKVNYQNSSRVASGGLVGSSDAKVTNSYVDVEQKIYTTDIGRIDELHIGGVTGRAHKNSQFKNVISVGSIETSCSTVAEGYLGGIIGKCTYIDAEQCVSAPRKIKPYSNLGSDFTIRGISGYINAVTKDVDNYYCTYINDELTEAEKLVRCSYYDHLNDSKRGIAVNLDKTTLLSEACLAEDYETVGPNGDEVTMFLRFDPELWNFGHFDGGEYVFPSLKAFD